jgi:hypothetical protein
VIKNLRMVWELLPGAPVPEKRKRTKKRAAPKDGPLRLVQAKRARDTAVGRD